MEWTVWILHYELPLKNWHVSVINSLKGKWGVHNCKLINCFSNFCVLFNNRNYSYSTVNCRYELHEALVNFSRLTFCLQKCTRLLSMNNIWNIKINVFSIHPASNWTHNNSGIQRSLQIWNYNEWLPSTERNISVLTLKWLVQTKRWVLFRSSIAFTFLSDRSFA
jgi:hypothetical protein